MKKKIINIYEKFDKKHDNVWLKSWTETTDTQYLVHRFLSAVRFDNMNSRIKNTIKYPTYIDASNGFRDFQEFVEWSISEYGYDLTEKNGRLWSLDKDLLVKDNKVYSPNTCIFVPNKVNTILSLSYKTRGELPLGVCLKKVRNCEYYYAQISDSSSVDYESKYFQCQNLAHQWWQKKKVESLERCIKEYHFHNKLVIGLNRIKNDLIYDIVNHRETISL